VGENNASSLSPLYNSVRSWLLSIDSMQIMSKYAKITMGIDKEHGFLVRRGL
jgi:hypothetical protein